MRRSDDSLTYQIIGAAMKVHGLLGPGLLESSYQDGLAMVFDSYGIPFRREAPVVVFLEGKPVGSPRRVDFICFDQIPVELKAVEGGLVPVHLAQILHYLRAARLRTGLLLNFGQASLQVRRVLSDPEARARSQANTIPNP